MRPTLAGAGKLTEASECGYYQAMRKEEEKEHFPLHPLPETKNNPTIRTRWCTRPQKVATVCFLSLASCLNCPAQRWPRSTQPKTRLQEGSFPCGVCFLVEIVLNLTVSGQPVRNLTTRTSSKHVAFASRSVGKPKGSNVGDSGGKMRTKKGKMGHAHSATGELHLGRWNAEVPSIPGR